MVGDRAERRSHSDIGLCVQCSVVCKRLYSLSADKFGAFVCVRVHIASHQSPVVSASTLYESELQYSVGGAGIGYPAAGGSSTSVTISIC